VVHVKTLSANESYYLLVNCRLIYMRWHLLFY